MHQLELVLNCFVDNLPKRPYCSNDLSQGLLIRPKEMAVNFKYLQANSPYYQHYLILDLDYVAVMAELLYSKLSVPLPNLLVENPKNGKAHLLFHLKTPIYTTDASRPKPIIYANAILKRLQTLLDADLGYSGLITKNPLSSEWRAYTLRSKPYSLNELARNLDLSWKDVNQPIQKDEASGLGRNCYVFHTARHWAYIEIRKYRGSAYPVWMECVFKHCQSLNNGLTSPLSYNEIKGIAKSISRYCWKNDAYCYQEFIDRQTRKGKLGASKGGLARSLNYQDLREQALEMKLSGETNKNISLTLGVTTRTLRNWFNLKAESAPKSDNSFL